MANSNSFLNPEMVYKLSGKLVMPCLALAIVLALVGFYVGFFVAPVDATQGNSYRILYIHVASAWMAMLLYVVMAIYCALGLITNNQTWAMIAAALAPTGALMAFLALWTGSLWGRPTWGTYWVWDARLTSALILFFFYLGFLALQNAIPDWRRADKACAVIGIVGVINVPIVYFSVQWWNTLHQGASITSSGSSIHPSMLAALLIMVFAFWSYAFGATFARLRSIILEREKDQEWAEKLVLKGGL
ncbi:MAG: heme ABC transporter permease CcmC [Burkholderiales bacterium]|nr:heme ABC transporter permease CcmC [Burkholderiales bacterium]